MKTVYLVLMVALIVLAFTVLLVGLTTSSGAPQEAVAAGLGCFLAILARMAQAAAHNSK